jgi:hypothetical protein
MTLQPAKFPSKDLVIATPEQALEACQEIRDNLVLSNTSFSDHENKLIEDHNIFLNSLDVVSPLLQASAWLGKVQEFLRKEIDG